LSQVEELEKNISDGNSENNFQLIRENKRKEEELFEMSSEVEKQRSEISYLEQELRDKNDEIESILLNSVSKETFIRNQFQSLTSEVRKLRSEDKEKKSFEEKIKDLEKQLKAKTYETEDWKSKFEQNESKMKELEETSTNMIGEITKGVGEKLALAKSREKDLALIEEKNMYLVEEVAKLEKQIIQLNNDHFEVREDLSNKLKEQTASIVFRDEELVKLKTQNGNLTKRFKEKVKEIQETLSKYNETLKIKNLEIGEKSKEISSLKEVESSQGKLITMLKESVTKLTSEKTLMKIKEEELSKKLADSDSKFSQMKSEFESKMNTKPKNTIKDTKLKKNPSKRKAATKHVKTMERLPSPKKLKLDINKEVFKQPFFELTLDLYRLPAFEMLKVPSISDLPPVQTQTTESSNWPLVPYYTNSLLVDLLNII